MRPEIADFVPVEHDPFAPQVTRYRWDAGWPAQIARSMYGGSQFDDAFGNFSPGQQANFETALSPSDEARFQAWKNTHAPNDSGFDYDLRGAFKSGFTADPVNGHWPDLYKKPNHPTFSNQSLYASDRPEMAGQWDGDTYVPPTTLNARWGNMPAGPAPGPFDERWGDMPSNTLPDTFNDRWNELPNTRFATPATTGFAITDFLKSLPTGLVKGLASYTRNYSSPQDVLTGVRDQAIVPTAERLEHYGESMHQPQTRAGGYGETIGEFSGNPVNWIGPGSMALKGAWNVGSALTSEAAGQAYEGGTQEKVARAIGAFGPLAAERLSLGYKMLPEGSAGVFGGRLAVTADQAALKRAEDMASKGAGRDQIWEQTGWFQGGDGKWRFEIPDTGAKFNRTDTMKSWRLGDAVDHPALFEAYPWMRDMKVSTDPTHGNASFMPVPFSSERGKITLGTKEGAPDMGSALHEIQHAIQRKEGFPAGSNVMAQLPWWNVNPSSQSMKNAYDRYATNAGEMEARNVTGRFEDPQFYDNGGFRPPWQTQKEPGTFAGLEAAEKSYQNRLDEFNKTVDRITGRQDSIKFTPVDHDPFSRTGMMFMPVDHDPFAQ